MCELRNLWERTLGTPPTETQFIIWAESHPADIVRRGILKAAQKNQQMGATMSQDHKVRFASKVMLTLSAQREENVENKRRINEEFGERAMELNPTKAGLPISVMEAR